MYVVITADANRGFKFNHRPVSTDSILSEHIDKIQYLRAGERGIFNPDPNAVNWNEVDTVYLFNFNRVYPADAYFKFPANSNFVLTSFNNFKGSSHDVITKEVYKKWQKQLKNLRKGR